VKCDLCGHDPAEDLAITYVVDLVDQGCWMVDTKQLDSMGLEMYAEAMRYLASLGRIAIVSDVGRRVIGHWRDHTKGPA